MISPEFPDWNREKILFWEYNPSKQLLRCIRKYQAVYRHRVYLFRVLKYWYILWHRFWSVCSGADIPINSNLGGGLMMPHPNGIVIHPRSKIGVNCLIFQQVTITNGVEIGGHVDIGAGAKIIGPVKIGDNARIGANAVVIRDVPPKGLAVGVPAENKA